MPSSALEDFVRDLKVKFLFWVKNQDRFVLIGLIFSVIPIPPSFLIGLFIGSINLFLFLTGKLERRYFNLILLTIFISIFNLLLTGYIYFSIYKTFWMLDIFRVGVIGFTKNYFSLIERFLFWVLDFVRNFFLGHDKMAQTV
jgi:hypothetical protein